MQTWIGRKARRFLIATSVAFAVGGPMLACSGGSGGDEGTDEIGGGEGDEEAGEFDAQATLIGAWKVRPHEDDMRGLQIINQALKPRSDVAKLKEILDPDPTPEEIAFFNELKGKNKSDPDIQFLAQLVKMLKGAKLTIDESTWIYEIGEERYEMSYTVTENSDRTMKVTLTNGPGGTEKHVLNFTSDDEIALDVMEPSRQRLRLLREGTLRKGKGKGGGGKGEGARRGGGGGDGKGRGGGGRRGGGGGGGGGR